MLRFRADVDRARPVAVVVVDDRATLSMSYDFILLATCRHNKYTCGATAARSSSNCIYYEQTHGTT